jgi:hypothetical protein
VTRERRERPPIGMAKTVYDFEHPNTPRRREEEVEVKTTVHENVVRKIVPGQEEGSWIVENRRVTTTTERMYFAPPRKSNISSTSAAVLHGTAKMEIDEPVISEQPDLIAHPNGVANGIPADIETAAPGEPHDEIARMLNLLEGERNGGPASVV